MYEELVKSLRECVYTPCEKEKNANCLAKNEEDCRRELMALAVDAIDELARTHDADTKEIEWLKKCVQDLPKSPKWITADDKSNFPNTDSGVVGYFGGGAFDQLRWYDFVTTLDDGTIVSENTERDVINEHCIAVYKLPEPPKEET